MPEEVKKPPLQHIAFIMDGNGRWAKAHGLPREAGHKEGAEVFRKIVRYCGNAYDIPIITVYAFSTENWKRPKHEVFALMTLLYNYLGTCVQEMMDERVHFRVIGEKSAFSDKLRRRIDEVEEITRNNPRLLNVALNYGGRDEIVHAVNKLIAEGKKTVTAEDISHSIYTGDCPDPDLIVRTSGEIRTSNFLVWQSAYSEYYFTDTLWPDMTSKDVDEAIAAYLSRKRRYGGI